MSWITAPGKVACSFQGLALGLTTLDVGWLLAGVTRSADISRLRPWTGTLFATCRTMLSLWGNAAIGKRQVATTVIRKCAGVFIIMGILLGWKTAPDKDSSTQGFLAVCLN